MKTGDEMFEELGYKKYFNKDITFFYQNNGINQKYGFEFYLKDREIYPVCYGEENEAILITMQELQAIYKKCQELGWI